MLKITVFAKEINGKNGKFMSLSAKGQYIPVMECNEEEFYNIRISGDQKINKEGQWQIGFEKSNDIWLDQRPEAEGKNIVHVKAKKVLFVSK